LKDRTGSRFLVEKSSLKTPSKTAWKINSLKRERSDKNGGDAENVGQDFTVARIKKKKKREEPRLSMGKCPGQKRDFAMGKCRRELDQKNPAQRGRSQQQFETNRRTAQLKNNL